MTEKLPAGISRMKIPGKFGQTPTNRVGMSEKKIQDPIFRVHYDWRSPQGTLLKKIRTNFGDVGAG